MAHSLSRMTEYANKLAARVERQKEKGEAAMGQALGLAEIGGAAFLAGYANAKYGTGGEYTVKGVPADLLAGLALHAAAFAGFTGKHSEHAHNLANGAISAYAVRMGQHMAATTV